MADDRLRILERRWAETNAPDARDAYLNERCRMGLPLVPEEGQVLSGVLQGPGPMRPLKGAQFYLPAPGWWPQDQREGPLMGWTVTVEGGPGHVRLRIAWDTSRLGVTVTTNHQLANSEPITFRFTTCGGGLVIVEGAAAGGRVMSWRVLLEREEPQRPSRTVQPQPQDDAQPPAAS